MLQGRFVTKWLSVALVTLTLVITMAASGWAGDKAQSVILLIGDGMGYAEVSLARLFAGQSLTMDSLSIKGTSRTRSANAAVTDSAAAATALATGFKTNNGMIAVTPDGKAKTTLLEAAQQVGKATGVITTTRISHATPACFIAHVDARADETAIVSQALQTKPDLMLGGGMAEFLGVSMGGNRRDGKNMVDEAKAAGYQVVTTPEALQTAGPGPLLGLFNSSYMTYELDRNPAKEPSLAEMTSVALQRLSTSTNGFFLMVEGGRIDNAGHNNDPAASVHETLAFDAAVKVALAYAKEHPDTLVVVTADHETGGLALQTNDPQIVADALTKVSATTETLGNRIAANRANSDRILDEAGLADFTSMQKSLVRMTTKAADIRKMLSTILSGRTKVTWHGTEHSGVDVPVSAFGAASDLFAGEYENTEIAKRIAMALQLQLN